MRCSFLGSLSLLLSLVWSSACTQYKPSSYRNQYGNTSNAVVNTPSGPLTDMSLIISNTKLAAAGTALKAKVTFGSQTVIQEFTPSGTQSTLSGLKLPAGEAGVLKVEILQGEVLKFVAKKSNTTIQGGAIVVIDDCLVLRAPWPGTINEGSCEWNVTEVAN